MLMNATPTPDEQDIKSALEQLSRDERNWMPKEINQWAMYPRKTSSSPLPESLKIEVTTKANELIENVLKPKYIQPPPENPQFNYFVDIYGK